MNDAGQKKPGWKQRLTHELVEYGVNVCYLSVVFAALLWYRRFLLAAHDVAYQHYGVAVIEALILGKVILIGSLMRLDRGLESKSLIITTTVRTVVFTVFVAVFKVVEHGIVGLCRGEGFAAGVHELSAKGYHEILANSLMLFLALFPFFGFRELERVLGQKPLRRLCFWRRRDAVIQPLAEP